MTDLELAQIVDKAGLLIAFGVPVVLVWRFRRWGVLVGALFQWITLIVVGEVLQKLNPAHDAALTDSIWFFVGWIGGFLYCLAVFTTFHFIRWIAARRSGPINN